MSTKEIFITPASNDINITKEIDELASFLKIIESCFNKIYTTGGIQTINSVLEEIEDLKNKFNMDIIDRNYHWGNFVIANIKIVNILPNYLEDTKDYTFVVDLEFCWVNYDEKLARLGLLYQSTPFNYCNKLYKF